MSLSTQQAVMVLVKAAQVAQTRGAFTLPEAGVISQAVAVFPTEQPATEDAVAAAAAQAATEESASEETSVEDLGKEAVTTGLTSDSDDDGEADE